MTNTTRHGTRTPTDALAVMRDPLGWTVTIMDSDGPIETRFLSDGGLQHHFDVADQGLASLGAQRTGDWKVDLDGATLRAPCEVLP